MFEDFVFEDWLFYGTIYYFLYSLIGLHFLTKYIKECKIQEALPFNNSVLKGFFTFIVCGFFTKIILLYSIFSTVFDFLRKKD